MTLVGLTGGTGCGKSLVAGQLKKLGAFIIDADTIAREVVRPGKPALRRIAREFGKSVLKSDGTLNRDKLGGIIFSNPGKRKRLNDIIHPFIFREEERQRREIRRKKPDAVVVFDAALLIETGTHELMDRVILVTADRKTQVARIMKRDGLSRKEALERIRSQLPSYRKKRYADYLLDTRLPAGALNRKVREIFKVLKGL
ncbi:MAG TPA: dephospho-CoA kinase [Nitrospiria bacterium]